MCVAVMPNTSPLISTVDTVMYVLEAAEDAGLGVRVEVVAGALLDRASREIADLPALRDAGCVAISDDGFSIQDRVLMREVLAATAQAGLPFFAHCEDAALSAMGVLTGAAADQLGVGAIPEGAEARAVERNIEDAAGLGVRLHVLHISEAPSVELVRQAKRDGIAVTAEACPHHLALTSDAALTHGANAKMAPPLRSERDRRAVVAGLLDGTIDAVASDHAPHTAEEKSGGLRDAPCGIVGLETLVSVSYTELVAGEGMGLTSWVELITSRPASLIGRPAGGFETGRPARISVFRLGDTSIDESWFLGMGRNTPFIGYPVAIRPALSLNEQVSVLLDVEYSR